MIEQTQKTAAQWIEDNVDRLSEFDFRVALEICWIAGFKRGLAVATIKETPLDEVPYVTDKDLSRLTHRRLKGDMGSPE